MTSTCGRGRNTAARTPWVGESRIEMTTNSPSATGPSTEGDPIRPGFLRSITQSSGTPRGRQPLILLVGVMILVVVFVIGLVIFSAMSRESQSYKDGVSVGGAIYASDSSAESAQQACKTAELRPPEHGGPPLHVNAQQWIQGCVDAFTSAQGGN